MGKTSKPNASVADQLAELEAIIGNANKIAVEELGRSGLSATRESLAKVIRQLGGGDEPQHPSEPGLRMPGETARGEHEK